MKHLDARNNRITQVSEEIRRELHKCELLYCIPAALEQSVASRLNNSRPRTMLDTIATMRLPRTGLILNVRWIPPQEPHRFDQPGPLQQPNQPNPAWCVIKLPARTCLGLDQMRTIGEAY